MTDEKPAEEREPEERVEDLDVPAEDSEDVKGGVLPVKGSFKVNTLTFSSNATGKG
jgi:hypothetical protein